MSHGGKSQTLPNSFEKYIYISYNNHQNTDSRTLVTLENYQNQLRKIAANLSRAPQ